MRIANTSFICYNIITVKINHGLRKEASTMKINMINNGISADSYVRDLPSTFVYYMDNEPFSVWKSVYADTSCSSLSLHGVRTFISFFLDGRDTFEVKVVDKVMLVGEAFNLDPDGTRIVPVNDMEIAEMNIEF